MDNMSKWIPLLFLALTSCISPKHIDKKHDTSTSFMELDFLGNYRTSVDSVENKKIVIDKHELLDIMTMREITENYSYVLLKEDTILIANNNKYSSLFEVYKNKYLVVSYVEGRSFAAGPDQIDRDNIIILDIEKGDLYKVHLNNIYLTRSKEVLLMTYPNRGIYREDSITMQTPQYCAIDSIDLEKDKLVLVNSHNVIKEYYMHKVSIPFILE